MSNDQPSRRPPAKSSSGGAPIGSTISIVIAVVAVVVGFLILRNINNDNSKSGTSTGPITTVGTVPNSTASSDVTTITTAPGVVTATTQPLVFSPGKVVVANASGQGGAAGTATKALASVGFTMGTPTDAFGAEKKITQTKVYYLAGSEVVAASVAQAYGGPASGVVASAMPKPIPVVKASIGDATVLVMLGTDLAGKPLPILAAGAPAAAPAITTVTPVGATTTNPGG